MKARTNQIRLIVNIQLFFCGGNIEKTTAFNLYYTCFVRFNLLFATVFPLVLIIKCKNLSTSFTLVQWSKSHFLLITQTFCKLLIDFKWIFKVFQIDINKSIFIKNSIFRFYIPNSICLYHLKTIDLRMVISVKKEICNIFYQNS